ncbi:MAG: zinc-ribbon domain-containing protein [Ruminococcaceae bacterium]|nr:zinc-ribbon domain-containing protein [Oscillospiraceae bacterium]
MAFCTKCGANIDDNAAICPSCGAPQQTAANNNAYVNPAPAPAQGDDFTATMDPNDIAANKVMAVLAYFGILFLIPLLAAPNSPYARFHANQGLVLFIVDIVVGVVGSILSIIPFVGAILSGVLALLVLVLVIMGIVNAATGKAKEVPIVGKIRIIK